jgi:hypothetical protein
VAPDAVLAAAARAEALDQEAAYLAAERVARGFALADRAFLGDREVLPSDEQLLEQLRDSTRGGFRASNDA